jgi:type I restriction enzyme S subunit
MSSKMKTTEMKEEAKTALVPKLRFPEFRGKAAWRPKLLGNLFTQREETGQTNLQLLSLMDKEGIIPQEDSNRKNNSSGDLSKYLRVAPGDIAYNTMRMWEGRSALSKLEGIVSPSYTICCPSPEANSLFFSYYFKTPQLIAEFARYSQGLVKDTLNLKFQAFARITVPTPVDLAEQQKIAECLSSLDELISAQARKVDALKTHKKGLMQQLFPREGETQPRLRFPEFRDAGEWVETTIGDLKPFVTSGSRGWAPFYAEKGELFVRITNLWRDSIYLDLTDCKFVQLPPGANEGVRTQLKEHDVLISITADIGIIGYVDDTVPSPAYINQHIALVRFDEVQLCSKYVAYFLASEDSQQLFRASTDTGTKAGMSLIGIQKIGLNLPSVPEQQRIASCLSSLDDLISAEMQKIEELKTHKKGLMQQLFPSMEEV